MILRSVIIEDRKGKRFFEVSFDEILSSGDTAERNQAIQERISDLSDILTCISRMTFDIFFYEKMSFLQSGASIEEAMLAGTHQGEAVSHKLRDVPGRMEGEGRVESNQPRPLKLMPHLRRSSNESALTLEGLIHQLSDEVKEKTGTNAAYWRVLSRDQHGRELQALTLSTPYFARKRSRRRSNKIQ